LPGCDTLNDDEFTFDTLNRIYRDEKGKTDLQKINRDFYPRLVKYLQSLAGEQLESAGKNGPDAAGAVMARDEEKRATLRAENILDIRLKKIMDIARLEAHGVKCDASNILPEEEALRQKLLHIVRDWRESAIGSGCSPSLAMGGGESKDSAERMPTVRPAAGPASDNPIAEGNRPPAQATAQAGIAVKKSPQKQPDTIVVAVLSDVPTFAGIDSDYSLKKGDVVTLPVAIGEVLCKSKKARRIL
jgi:DNA replication initiation complex subunit (GINS family)